MSTADVAKQLVALCSQGKFEEAMNSLYADDIVSVEAHEMPAPPGGQAVPREMRGIDAVRGKSKWWTENHTVHSAKVTGPFTSVDKFAVVFALDVTFKPMNKRNTMEEIAVYTVKNDKIVHEEFLYKA